MFESGDLIEAVESFWGIQTEELVRAAANDEVRQWFNPGDVVMFLDFKKEFSTTFNERWASYNIYVLKDEQIVCAPFNNPTSAHNAFRKCDVA